MKIRSLLCAILVIVMLFSVPCVATETFSKYKTIPTEHGNVSEYESDLTESPLYQSTLVAFGDSLCYSSIDRATQTGNADTNTEAAIYGAGYAGRIATKYDMKLTNVGVRGATLANNPKGSGIIYNQILKQKTNVSKAQRENVEFVLLEGGVNDASAQSPLGVISEDGKNLDLTTLAGATEYTIQLAQETYPYAQIGFLIMYQMPRDKNQFRSDPEIAGQYMDLIIEICEKYSIPYLDFFHDETFNRDVFKVNTTEFVGGDGIHMTVKGYDTLTPYIINWLEDPIRRQSGTISKPSTDTSETEPAESEPTESEPTESKPSDPADSDTTTIGASDPNEPPTDGAEGPSIGLIIGIAAGAVVVIGGAVVAVVLVQKKKKQ